MKLRSAWILFMEVTKSKAIFQNDSAILTRRFIGQLHRVVSATKKAKKSIYFWWKLTKVVAIVKSGTRLYFFPSVNDFTQRYNKLRFLPDHEKVGSQMMADF